MITANEVRKAKFEAILAAGQRWNQRQAQRRETNTKLSENGAGGADSPERQSLYAARELLRSTAVAKRREGNLPIGIERIIGPSIDLIEFAPSEAARQAGQPVARIVVTPEKGYQAEGLATGFLISPRLLITNHHVLPSRSSAVGLSANFHYETDEHGVQSGAIFELAPDDFYLSNKELDFAIVAVSPKSIDGQPIEALGLIRLIEATPKILLGQPVNIIQHPNGGPKQYAVADNRLIDILDSGFLHYSTDTLPGSSGSPAFNKSWELVALHHSGVPEIKNGQIWSKKGIPWDTEKMNDEDINWVANEGIRVSTIVKFLGNSRFEKAAEQSLLNQVISLTSDPLEATASVLKELSDKETQPPTSQSMANNVFNFSGPVTIHVYGGTATTATPMTTAFLAPQPMAPEATIRFDRNYKAKKGYLEDFLSIPVPLPTVSPQRSGELLTVADGKPFVLKYHHYSLVMNRERRLQMWSAVNVDYSPAKRSEKSRQEFGTDKWIPDPRIRGEEQIVDREFYAPAAKIDRGHIVRREDNAWGNVEEEIEFANSDTFHWTNCTPQHEAFNRENPGQGKYPGIKGIWGEFEGYVQKQLLAEDKKCCILAGPVLAKNDPTAEFDEEKIQYPIQFWKVIAVVANGKLKVYGFVFSQKDVVDDFGIEFTPGKFSRYQKTLTFISDLTGVVFARSLLDADQKG